MTRYFPYNLFVVTIVISFGFCMIPYHGLSDGASQLLKSFKKNYQEVLIGNEKDYEPNLERAELYLKKAEETARSKSKSSRSKAKGYKKISDAYMKLSQLNKLITESLRF